MQESLISWLMLPSYDVKTGAPSRIKFLLLDLLQLLFASQLLAMFHIERNDKLRTDFGGGHNNSDLTVKRHTKGSSLFVLLTNTDLGFFFVIFIQRKFCLNRSTRWYEYKLHITYFPVAYILVWDCNFQSKSYAVSGVTYFVYILYIHLSLFYPRYAHRSTAFFFSKESDRP